MDNENMNMNDNTENEDFEAEYEEMMEHTEFSSGKIINVDINREMRKSFLDYSMSVIVANRRVCDQGCRGSRFGVRTW